MIKLVIPAAAGLAALAAFGWAARAQEALAGPAGPGGPPAAMVQEKLRQWVLAKKAAGEEAAAWEAEQATLADLNALRREELARLDEFIEAAGSRLAEAEAQRAELLREEAALKEWRVRAEERVAALEAGLRAQAARFPPPLRGKADEALRRLEDAQPDVPLQNRWRDALVILGEAGNFAGSLVVDTELREIGGERMEVEVLYLGFSQAWYVDRTGRRAGRGVPGPAGWEWTEDNSLASRVRGALAIHRKQAAPAFVALPFAPRKPE